MSKPGAESRLKAEVVAWLEANGWEVFIFDDRRRTRKATAGWPDVVAFKSDVVLLIELKAEGGKLRPAQIDFIHRMMPHCGAHVRYVVAFDLFVMQAVANQQVPPTMQTLTHSGVIRSPEDERDLIQRLRSGEWGLDWHVLDDSAANGNSTIVMREAK